MLDDFKLTQALVYNILINSIKNDKISHAYLFEINGGLDEYNMINAFVKTLACPQHYTNNNKCSNCNICSRIDSNNYTEINYIEPEGLLIKKEQLLNIQDEYNKIGIEGKYRIYIVKECEKMNKQTANSILKFLEEPVPNVIAILVTSNINKVLDTIISRCQHIKLYKEEKNKSTKENICNLICKTKADKENFILNTENQEIGNNIVNFIIFYEKNKLNTLIYIKEKWNDIYNTRELVDNALNLMTIFYFDALKFKFDIENYFFVDYLDALKFVASVNSEKDIIHKLEILIKNREYLKCNLNLNLLINRLIIEFGGEFCGNCSS